MIFYALTSAGPPPREICWNPSLSLKGEGFNTSRGAQQMLMYQKSMFDRYYCSKHFFRSKTSGKLLQKGLLTCTYNGAEKLVTCEGFQGKVIATMHSTDDDVSFYGGPGMLIRKTAKPCINSTWIAVLIHGFVPVKT